MSIKNQNTLVAIFCVLLLLTNIALWTYNWRCMKSDNYKEEISRLNGLKDSLTSVKRFLNPSVQRALLLCRQLKE